jgi:hypothetical protein
MNVHIPQAGNKKFTRSVYYLRALRQNQFFCITNPGYAITGYHNSHIRSGLRSGDVDDRDMCDNKRARRGCLLRLRKQQGYYDKKQ